ncbi:ferrous iron transport protein B [Coriobacterium glomerans PW2]|uniref:Fe(2+) transporter FeoB n=1 Tax=Coriobacterium glomerans (strain ATCC 49209 / DSM 20642 / JCM 10262 / PW2) TaxID=700015 RepID=F2N8V7_CORGP|nr:ferrous iron transporter B [Coriobacterium glomerans]AEB07557.1 ferrous iron transport protein B [Coriobacterium glomerans PW2]
MSASSLNVALAGNPNCGKTTLFNLVTGQNGYVGNWPGVTVEKKEARVRADHQITVTDLPGIYSLSPYSPEERVSRDYLMSGVPDAVVNIVDATNLERNLYLSLQIIETGLPTVIALNMGDLVERAGDRIDTKALSRRLGCPVIMISALKNKGVDELIAEARQAATQKARPSSPAFDTSIECVVSRIEQLLPASVAARERRYWAVKLFERDADALTRVHLSRDSAACIEQLVSDCERDCSDDAESIITSERYATIAHIIDDCLKRAPEKMSVSEKIDRVVTNRALGLPIFAVVMFLVYFIAVFTVGKSATDFTNDQIFDQGWFVLGQGRAAYDEAADRYTEAQAEIAAFMSAADEHGVDVSAYNDAMDASDPAAAAAAAADIARDPAVSQIKTTAEIPGDDDQVSRVSVDSATLEGALAVGEPDPASFGPWVPSVPAIVGGWLTAGGTQEGGLVYALLIDGVIGGLGAILGFLPQMVVLFIMLSFLEDCGYMARVAFIMDRVFRRFGLSGKSFIPMLISSGCGVPGIMATKTIENEKDRRMTVMTTTFIPCGAKLPIIALLMGALVSGTSAWWISPLFYFLGAFAVIGSGIMLKKTRLFRGRPTPFVMELPTYHMPAVRSWALHVWERCWSFIKKAGTIIFASTVAVWFLSNFGVYHGAFGYLPDMTGIPEEFTDYSVLAGLGGALGVIFAPLGFGSWQAAAMSVTGLIAKENVVATAGSLLHISGATESDPSMWSAFSAMFGTAGGVLAFGAFNLLCAPCFAAMGTIRNQMKSGRWTAIALGYECGLAWVIGLIVNQMYLLATGGEIGAWTVIAFIAIAAIAYQLLKPMPKDAFLDEPVLVEAVASA